MLAALLEKFLPARRPVRRPVRQAVRPRATPQLEVLEDRAVPVLHVASFGGSDVFGNGSPTAPFQSIQKAVNIAGTGEIIKVAQGSYTYNPAQDIYFGILGTNAVVTVFQKQIAIIGSYIYNPDPVNIPGVVTNWNTPDLQFGNVPRSSIDGGGIARGVLVTTFPGGALTGVSLQNFFVQNGLAQPIPARPGIDAISGKGGGMLAENSNPLFIENVVFQNSRAFGTFSAGTGGLGVGGGLAVFATPGIGAALTLNNVTFFQNQALGGPGGQVGGFGQGGGLFADSAQVFGTNVNFSRNLAQGGNASGAGNSGNIRGDGFGGGLNLEQLSGDSFFNGLVVLENAAVGGDSPAGVSGGGFGGGLGIELSGPMLTVTGGEFRRNLARGGSGAASDPASGLAAGAGIQATNANIVIDGVTIESNSIQPGSSPAQRPGPNGGGIDAVSTIGTPIVVQVLNSMVMNNEIGFGQGVDELTGGAGAGAWFKGATVTIVNTTFDNNRFVNASTNLQGEAFAASSPTGVATVVDIRDSNIFNHTNTLNPTAAAVHIFPGNTGNFTRVNFRGNSKDTNADGQPGPAGTFNFFA
jgi:hypothetical protein